MLEAASLLLLFLAFALLHGAAPSRFPARRAKASRSVFACMRTGALASGVGGVALWTRAESTTAALLVAVAALGVVATAFVLLAPLYPRVLWASVIACPPLIAVLALLGGGHG